MTGFGAPKSRKKKRSEKTTKISGKSLKNSAIDHHTRGDLKNAEKGYREAINTGHADHAIFSNLGIICKNSGRIEEAIYLYLKAIELEPNHPDAYTNLGNLYRNLGNLDQALASTLKSLELKAHNPAAKMNLGLIYKDLGNLDQALASTLESLELQPDNPTALANLGGIYKDLGVLDQALASTLKSLELRPDNPTALINLGGIYKDLGDLEQALASTLKSLELKPNNPDALINLGSIYKDLGNLEQALAATLKSLELRPENPDALINLSSIYKDLGNLDQALTATLKSLELKPDNPDALINLGSIYKDLGNLDQALASTLKSLELKSDNHVAHMNLGAIYQDIGNLDKALTSTLKSLELKTDSQVTYMNLGGIYKEQKDIYKAKEAYKQAYENEPTIENECLSKLSFPWNISHQEQVDRLRSDYLENAKSIFKGKDPQQAKCFLDLSLFTLAYQNGDNDKNFLETVGKLVSPWLQIKSKPHQTELKKDQLQTLSHQNRQRPRVGFYFDNTEKDHVVFRHYFNIVKNCHKNGIEVIIIKGPVAAKQNSTELQEQSTLVVQLYSSLEQSVKTLKRLELQMLIYTEIYSSPTPYCLAHNRIAPIQAVLPGNLITTGIPTIDYFISSEYMEKSNSEHQYTEQLIKLKGMPWGITDMPQISSTKNRNYFDLPEKSNIFGMLHNLIKFHPDWDDLLEKIAQNNENAIFILSGKGSQPSLFLKNRWEKTAPTFLAKCKFFNRMSKNDYLRLLACTDVVLDPIHMGCGTTSIDALSLGIPIITKPEDHPRTRIVFGLYKIMGINNAPIALTSTDYITCCAKMLNDSQDYTALKESIKANYHKVIAASYQSINEITEVVKRLTKTSS